MTSLMVIQILLSRNRIPNRRMVFRRNGVSYALLNTGFWKNVCYIGHKQMVFHLCVNLCVSSKNFLLRMFSHNVYTRIFLYEFWGVGLTSLCPGILSYNKHIRKVFLHCGSACVVLRVLTVFKAFPHVLHVNCTFPTCFSPWRTWQCPFNSPFHTSIFAHGAQEWFYCKRKKLN